MTNDVKSQIKFMEELDKLEKKKKDEAEREKLMKAAKSRSKGEDVELSKLKQKAKEVIQAENDEMRRQDANKTALAAIGPRKKRKLDEVGGSSGASGGANLSNQRVVSALLSHLPSIFTYLIPLFLFSHRYTGPKSNESASKTSYSCSNTTKSIGDRLFCTKRSTNSLFIVSFVG